MRASRLLLLIGLLWAIPAIAAARVKRERPHVGDETSDEIDFVAIFEGRDLRSRAAAFRGGRVLCWYGGGELDLSNVQLNPGGVRLEATCIFGGMSIRVPLDWRVDVRARSIFGGVGDGRPTAPLAGDAPTLTIEALSIFGGIGIVGPRDRAV